MPATTLKNEPGTYARNGLIVIHDEKRLGRARIILRRGPDNHIDLSAWVQRVETICQVDDVDRHVVTFISGVMPDGEQA